MYTFGTSRITPLQIHTMLALSGGTQETPLWFAEGCVRGRRIAKSPFFDDSVELKHPVESRRISDRFNVNRLSADSVSNSYSMRVPVNEIGVQTIALIELHVSRYQDQTWEDDEGIEDRAVFPAVYPPAFDEDVAEMKLRDLRSWFLVSQVSESRRE